MTASSFLIKLDERLARGPAVLATVMQCTGSTPRQPAAQMACGPDWLLGTIGGGAAESKVITAARKAMRSHQPSEVTIDLRGTVDQVKDGICGGTMLIRLDPLDETIGKNIQQANHDLAEGHSVRQCFPSHDRWQLKTVDDDESIPQDDPWLLKPDPMLLIVGGGHCGVALAHAADSLGFQILLQDDRADVALADELPKNALRSCKPVGQILDSLDWPSPLYVAMVTRSYQHDVQAACSLASRSLRYAGLMGSRRRLAQVMKLLKEHDAPDSFIGFLDAPIGVDIPAETPEEIAISICARLIQVKNAPCDDLNPTYLGTAARLSC